MNKYVFFILCIALTSCTKKEETKTSVPETTPMGTSSNVLCENKCGTYDQKVCDYLFKEYVRCNNKKTEYDCAGFVSAFSNALPKTVECTNTCDRTPFKMPISYSCDEIDKSGYPKITERASHLLSKLKFKMAVDLFLSDKFYAILDGALAEDMIPEIEKHKKRNKSF
ncbi:MAG: hypothetical protein H6623_06640 [Bdellovibrionaceae bacterium]|nr:hypothetical protein [Pseudobdellovibrionaceae bacterium]